MACPRVLHRVSAHLTTRSSMHASLEHRGRTSRIGETCIANRTPTHCASQRVLYSASAPCASRIAHGAGRIAHRAWRRSHRASRIMHRHRKTLIAHRTWRIRAFCIGAMHTGVVHRHRPSEPRITPRRFQQRDSRITRCSSQSASRIKVSRISATTRRTPALCIGVVHCRASAVLLASRIPAGAATTTRASAKRRERRYAASATTPAPSSQQQRCIAASAIIIAGVCGQSRRGCRTLGHSSESSGHIASSQLTPLT